MEDSIRPRSYGASARIRPNGGSVPHQFGNTDGEVARLRSLVHSLMGRIKKLEEDILSINSTNLDVGRRLTRGNVVEAPTITVPTHYHTFLVYPGTVLPAFEIDTDGGAIFQNIWKTFIDSSTKNKSEQFDANLGVGSRDWTSWTTLPPSIAET